MITENKPRFLCCTFETEKPVKYAHDESNTVSFSVELPQDDTLFEAELDCFEVLQPMVHEFMMNIWKTFKVRVLWETVKYSYKDSL